MPISIYNYAESKLPLLIEVESYLNSALGDGAYYYDSDWQKGPNTMVVFKEPSHEELYLEPIQVLARAYKRQFPVSVTAIERQKAKYQKIQLPLQQLERREAVEAMLEEDGAVLIRGKKAGLYNSKAHEASFIEYRTRLNPIHIKIAQSFQTLDDYQKSTAMLEMFQYIATLFKEGPQIGYLSFLSHAQGFFTRLKKTRGVDDMSQRFEEKRQLLLSRRVSLPSPVTTLLKKWRRLWKAIAEEMATSFDRSHYEGDVQLDVNKQLEMLEENLSGLDNSFHQSLRSFHKETGLLSKEEIIVYRDVVNLFYLTLPIFEQSMLKKQFYAYCTAKHYEALYGKAYGLGFDE